MIFKTELEKESKQTNLLTNRWAKVLLLLFTLLQGTAVVGASDEVAKKEFLKKLTEILQREELKKRDKIEEIKQTIKDNKDYIHDAFLWAIQLGYDEIVYYMLHDENIKQRIELNVDEKPDIDNKKKLPRNPLLCYFSAFNKILEKSNFIAISCYESSVIMLLGHPGIDVSINYKGNFNPLIIATSCHPVIINALLKKKESIIDLKSDEGFTALTFFANISSSIKKNLKDNSQKLEPIVKKKKLEKFEKRVKEVIELLLEAGIDPTATVNIIGKDNQEKKVKASDMLLDYPDIKRILEFAEKEDNSTREEKKRKFSEKNQKEKKDDDQYNKLIEAIYNDDVDSLKKIIDANMSFLTKEDTISFYMPLHMAVIWGRTDIVKVLLSYNDVNVNGQNHYGVTPLLLAVGLGYDDIFDILIKKEGIDINKTDNHMFSPLLYSALLGNERAFNLLLSKDHIDINVRDAFGNTVLNCAADNCRVDMVNNLIKQSELAINTQNNEGATALHNVVNYLGQLILRCNQAKTEGRTVLFNKLKKQIQDVKPKCKKIIDTLIQAGIDPTLRMPYKDKSIKASDLITFTDIRESLLKAEDNYISKKKNKRTNKPPPKNGKSGIIFFIIIFSLVAGGSTAFYLMAELLRKKKEEERKALEKKADAESAKDEKNKSKKTKRRKRLKKMAL